MDGVTVAQRPTQAEIDTYAADGVVKLAGVFSPEWIALLREGVEENMRNPGRYGKRYTPEGSPGMFFGDYCNWQRIEAYRRFLTESPAAALAGGLMGSKKVNVFHEHVLVKEPGTREPTPWHNDQPYWTVDGFDVCSMWIPLDPVARENGVEYVRGSHRAGVWYTPRRFADQANHPANDPRFIPVPDIAGNRDQYDLVGFDLEPGDCVVFHGLTLHGAPGNASSTLRRRAVSVRWTGDDARFVLREGFMSPPPPETGGPQPGAPMDSAVFPVVWRA
jgi:ectoine hydroxylase-related dioxygenase (phytanoyl-CoA dioxygenase family)